MLTAYKIERNYASYHVKKSADNTENPVTFSKIPEIRHYNVIRDEYNTSEPSRSRPAAQHTTQDQRAHRALSSQEACGEVATRECHATGRSL